MTDEETLKQTEEQPTNETPEELKIRLLEEEAKESKDKYLRLLADTENAKKRLLKDKQESAKFAIENVIEDFLIPMDNFENALTCAQGMSGEVRNWATGFQMILTQFKDVLQQHGIVPFQSEGALFDPNLHEAVETEETDRQPEGTILKEFARGYKCGERTIRPARVKVAKRSPLKETEKNDDINE